MADYFDIPEDLQVVNYDPEEEQKRIAAQELEEERLTQGMEQQAAEAQAAQQEMKALEDEESASLFDKYVPGLEEETSGLRRKESVLTGTLDTVFDAVGLLPWLKPVDKWWDDRKPKYENPLNDAVRKASSVIIPSLIAGGTTVGAIGKATQAMNISKRSRILGGLAAELGVDTAVTAIASTSTEDENIAQALNEWLGTDIPWATRDEDSPDVRRQKNILENAGMGAGLSVLQAYFALRKAAKIVPTDPEAAKLAEAAEALKVTDDTVADSVEAVQQRQILAQTDEAEARMLADPEGQNYDAFINEPAEPQARAVINTDANPIAAKVDQARIQNNVGTTNGRMTPVVTESFQKKFMQAADGTERAENLDEVFQGMRPGVDAIIGKTKLSAAQIDAAVDNLTNSIFNADLQDFTKTIEDMKKTLYEGEKFFGEEEWVIASQSFKRAFEEMFNPDNMRASAMITQQAGDNVADAARAVSLIGDTADTTRQQEIIFDKLNIIAQEIRANQYIAGRSLEYKKLVKNANPAQVSEWMADQAANFTENLQKAKEKSATVIQTLKDISKENPEYLKPLIKAYDATNGKVDTIYKLNRWAEEHIGVIKKGLYDQNPSIPSYVLQGLDGVRYNSILNGLAPVRALTGGLIASTLKPISILAGSAVQGDTATMKRAMFAYGSFAETLQRGLKMMGEEWRYAISNPEKAALRGRGDLYQAKLNDFETMDAMAEVWRKEGKDAKVFLWDTAKWLHAYNNNKFSRLGVNAMFALDGMFNSFQASQVTRSKAYDEILEQTGGVIDDNFMKLFEAKQQELYSKAFNKDGLLTDEAAKFAAGEIALNLDSNVVNNLQNWLNNFPVAKSLFMFPKTGVNALEFGWSFNPASNLMPAVTKARKVLKAKSTEEITEALSEHGLEYSMEAFQALKSEYIGRQLMGSAVVMGASMWALNGNLTGNGPQDAGERNRMIAMGWQPLSIKVPGTDKWVSYKGFEPFDILLGLIGDVVYQGSRVDQSWSEDIAKKILVSITMNITNKSFLSGFEPLVGMLSGDEGNFSRFMANNIDSLAPYAGTRSILSKAITPQLKDVERDFWGYLANRNKFLPGVGDGLEDMVDLYTGEPIKYFEPMTAAINSVLPFFKVNGGMEPWRQWLLSTGWDNLNTVRTNPITSEPLNPKQRQFVNNWIANNVDLKGSIEKMMSQPDSYWDKQIKLYTKRRGLQTQNQFPIKQSIVHKELDRLHNDAFKYAWAAYEQQNAQAANIGALKNLRDRRLQSGAVTAASKTQQQVQTLLDMNK
jgi:hypothetical protein